MFIYKLSFFPDGSRASICLGLRQLLDHALAGPLPLLQEDQEIGHLLTVRPLVELPDDVGADLAGGGQDPKQIPTRRWSERVSEASRILPKHWGASVSAAWPPGELPDQLLARVPAELRELVAEQHLVVRELVRSTAESRVRFGLGPLSG